MRGAQPDPQPPTTLHAHPTPLLPWLNRCPSPPHTRSLGEASLRAEPRREGAGGTLRRKEPKQRDKLEELTSVREGEFHNKNETVHMKGRNQMVNPGWEQYRRNWFVIHHKLVRSPKYNVPGEKGISRGVLLEVSYLRHGEEQSLKGGGSTARMDR